MRRVLLSLRLALEAVIFVVLFNSAFLLLRILLTGPDSHIAIGLLGIAIAVFIAVILVLDAMRVRVKLNDLDAQLDLQFPPASE